VEKDKRLGKPQDIMDSSVVQGGVGMMC